MKSIFAFTAAFILLLPEVYGQDFAAPSINAFSLTTQGARSSPYLVDIDDDGDLDLFTGYVSGDFGFYENIGFANAPNYGAVVINPFIISPLGGSAAPLLADLDNDGDFDLMAGSSGGLRYYENVGNASVPSFGPAIANPFGIIDPPGNVKPDLVDIDNDDDLDLLVGTTDGNIYYFENTGSINTPVFAASVMNPFGFSDVGNRSAPEFADIDGDGDLDALIGDQSGQFNYFENVGNSNAPNFNFVSQNPFNLSSVGQDAKPNLADLDDDGDYDLLSGNAVGEYYYYENIAPLGIQGHFSTQFIIHPNPFGELAYIEMNRPFNKSVVLLTIIDRSGRIISSRIVNIINKRIELYREELNEGLYFLFIGGDISPQFVGKILIH